MDVLLLQKAKVLLNQHSLVKMRRETNLWIMLAPASPEVLKWLQSFLLVPELFPGQMGMHYGMRRFSSSSNSAADRNTCKTSSPL